MLQSALNYCIKATAAYNKCTHGWCIKNNIWLEFHSFRRTYQWSKTPKSPPPPPLNNQPPRVILTWLRNSLFLGGCFPRLVEACSVPRGGWSGSSNEFSSVLLRGWSGSSAGLTRSSSLRYWWNWFVKTTFMLSTMPHIKYQYEV